jgi:peptidoglycan/xylan/chitin deacetylase (PgdA/CDA1 family)
MAATAERVPVLMYHRIGPTHNVRERRFCIPPDQFARHMYRLASLGMQACSLKDFCGWLEQKTDLPDGSFLLTFDDGFLGVYEHAAAILEKLGWPATVFLVSKLVGKTNEWCKVENPDATAYPLLAPEHIAAMRKSGFTFQSHTRLHTDLTTLTGDGLAEALAGSRQDLEELLGEEVRYLAYPYGRHDDRVISATRAAGYYAAFSTQSGFNRRSADHYRVRRLDVYGTDTPGMLTRKIFYGSNDGSWQQVFRYFRGRVTDKLGLSGP